MSYNINAIKSKGIFPLRSSLFRFSFNKKIVPNSVPLLFDTIVKLYGHIGQYFHFERGS